MESTLTSCSGVPARLVHVHLDFGVVVCHGLPRVTKRSMERCTACPHRTMAFRVFSPSGDAPGGCRTTSGTQTHGD
ncbi:hypothetical protein CEXT_371381 [Caerostris extrusa]|uniref:Uncharacterized protein n=1 Tax=Caerostris extrusa TaxID=172846 RepID=A0AAV4TLI7_CAEEX|nr:hypothetical protein CEXT_371381 [Caerostris extrusa]